MKSYTVKDVADLLQVDPETVRRWIRDKKLVAEKSSNKGGNKILETELNAFLRARPKYAANAGALLAGGIVASTVMLATYTAGKVIEANNATFDRGAVLDFIQSEISSREALIASKQKSIRQIEKEIAAEQKRINELKSIIQNINESETVKEE